MAGITKAIAQEQLDLYLAAEAAALRNQSYKMPDGRELRRSNLKEIQAGIDIWDRRLKRLSGGTGPRVSLAAPR